MKIRFELPAYFLKQSSFLNQTPKPMNTAETPFVVIAVVFLSITFVIGGISLLKDCVKKPSFIPSTSVSESHKTERLIPDMDLPEKVPFINPRDIFATLVNNGKSAKHYSHGGRWIRSKIVSSSNGVVTLRRGKTTFKRFVDQS
jgi:hypothetical protein